MKSIPMSTKRYSALGYVLLTFFNGGLAQDLSLKSARELLLKNNGEYQAETFSVNKLQEDKKVSKGLHYPTFRITGNYFHLQDDIAVDLNEERDLLAGLLNVPDPNLLGNWRRELQGQDFAFASAGFNLPLFTGGRINAANTASGIRLDIGTKQQGIKERDLTIQLITAYYRVKLSDELLDLRKEVLHTISLHKERADKFFANGVIPEVETLNAQVALSNAQREVVAAERDLSLAKTVLENLIGEPMGGGLITVFHIPQELPSLEDFQRKVVEESFRLQVLDHNSDLASVNIKVEKSQYLPALAAQGSYRFYNESFAIGQTDWFVGVGLNWTLFNGFQREHKIKAAKHVKSKVKAVRSQAELSLQTLTEKLYNNMEKQYEMYTSLESDQNLAEQLHFMRQRAFEEGLGTSLEVVDATVRLSQVRFQRLRNLYEFSITKGELMVYLGETEHFLNQEKLR